MSESYRAFARILGDQMAGRPPSGVPVYPPEARERIKGEILRAREYLRNDNAFRAEKISRKLLDEFPGQPDVLYMLGLVAAARDRHREAISHFRESLQAAPAQGAAWKSLGSVLLTDRQLATCQQAFVATLALNPADSEALYQLGFLKIAEGDWGNAQAYLERAIALAPNYVSAYNLLLQVQGFEPDETFLASLERISNDPALPPDQAVTARFALARHYERQGLADKFVTAVREANRLQAATAKKKLNPIPGAFNLSKQALSQELLGDAVPAAQKKLTPVFVVGPPRSGTTLAEQILGCHPLIFPGDELPTLIRDLVTPLVEKTGEDYPLGLQTLTISDLIPLAENYQQAMLAYTQTHPFITDKKFDNLFYLGIVRKALPWAKVIWLRRNVMDNAFSIFTNHFSNEIWYSYNQRELASFFGMCLEARAFWETVMPGFILDVQYEKLVRNP
ncbi:MAG TPA: sulfotransferase, partial [Sphingomonadales bacterium]|nr:sulfotransferase [Sphingomonadales bacterium]